MSESATATGGGGGAAWAHRLNLGHLLQRREFSLLIILAAVVVMLSVMTDSFTTPGNIRVLLQGMTVDMIIAVPMAISLIAGNIDFSVGSNVALTSTTAGLLLAAGMPVPAVLVVVLVLGATLGLVNAVFVEKLKITPLVATLGTWMAYKGLALVIAGGRTIGDFPEEFTMLGRMEPFGIPISIIYMLLAIVAGVLVMKYVRFFNNAYYLGANRESARLAGINVPRFTYASFAITGMMAAFAGLVLAARLGAASQQAGDGL